MRFMPRTGEDAQRLVRRARLFQKLAARMMAGHRIGVAMQQKQRRLQLRRLCQGLPPSRMHGKKHPRGNAMMHQIEIGKRNHVRRVPRHPLGPITRGLDKPGPAPHGEPGERELPPRRIASEAQPRRSSNQPATRHRLLLQKTQGDLPTETVAEEKHRTLRDRLRSMNLPQVLQENPVFRQIPTRARRTPVTPQIPTHHFKSTSHQNRHHMPIAPRMLPQPMGDNDCRPCSTGRHRNAHKQPSSALPHE